VSKTKYWILNVVGGVCGCLLAANLVIAQLNDRAGQAVNQTQQQLNRAQQIQNTMQNFAIRIAQGGQNEPALRDLLARHELQVNFASTNAPNP
jgi:hypothetical protein